MGYPDEEQVVDAVQIRGEEDVVYAGLPWKVIGASNTKWRILVTKSMPGPEKWCEGVLVGNGCRVEVCQSSEHLTKQQITEAIKGHNGVCHAVIGQLTETWDAEMFDILKAHGGKAYSNMSVGFDNVDLAAATARHIPVGNTPGVSTETVAEMAVVLTFAAARRIVDADKFTRQGKYKGWLPTMFVGHQVYGSTVGIIGAGRIGASYARMMVEGHRMNLIYYDLYQNKSLEDAVNDFSKYLTQRGEKPVTVRRAETVEEVFREADVLSLHTNLSASTRGLVNRERLQLMKPTAVLINTARGPCVNEDDLAEHCASHPNFFVGLDVFEHEPLINQKLAGLPNIVFTPHIASAALSARTGMAMYAACNVLGVLEGWPAWHNPDDYFPYVTGEGESWKYPRAIPAIVNRKDLPPSVFETNHTS